MGAVVTKKRKDGTYNRLEPVIEEMYMAGIRLGVIAEVLGLSERTLQQRSSEWGLPEVREMYRRDLAQKIAEKHGVKAS